MVPIGAGLQDRVLAASTRCFGPDGDALIHAVAQQTFSRPLDQLTYGEMPRFLEAVACTARVQVGTATAASLAGALMQLQDDVDAGLSGRLLGMLTSRVGSAAERLLSAACTERHVAPEAIDPSRLPELAEAIHGITASLLGSETAAALRASVLTAASTRPAGLTRQILLLAQEHLGEDGDGLIDRLCREQLETALDDLDAGSVRTLAAAVQRHGPDLIGSTLAAAFVTDASAALASPAEPLREKILELTRGVVGPFAPEFLDEVCGDHGLPFQAVDYEHLTWLAEVLRSEAEPLAGKAAADGLARDLRACLTSQQ